MSIHVMRVKFAGETDHESGIETIALAKGTLLVNNSNVDCEVRNGFHNWVRARPDGTKEFGSLKISMFHGMCMARGSVLFNDRKAEFSAASMLEYTMTVVRPEGNDPWYSLAMGFVEQTHDDETVMVPMARLLDRKDQKKSDKLPTYSDVLLGTEAEHLIAKVQFKPLWLSNGFSRYGDADNLTFSLDYATLSGQTYEYSKSSPGNRDNKFDVRGECTSHHQLTAIRGIVQDMPARSEGGRQVGGHNASDADFLVAASLQGKLSVEELSTLPPPAMDRVHQISFDRLKALMLHEIDQDQLDLFGETRPVVGTVLKQSDVDLAKNNADIRNFLRNDFSIGYLSEAFSKSDIKEIKNEIATIQNRDAKMTYFWTGDGDTSFSKSKGYNLAMSSIMDNTYGDFVPGLAPYKNDHPADWAKKLYEYCTRDPFFTGLALQTAQDLQKRVLHLSSILHVLDPQPRLILGGSGKPMSYATALHDQVVNRRLSQVIEYFDPKNEDDFVEFLTEYFKLEFANLLADDQWQGEVNQTARNELAELMKEFNADSTDHLVFEMMSLIKDSVNIIVSKRDLPVCNRINEWAQENRFWSCRTFMTMGVYAFGLYSCVVAFQNWDKLETAEKITVVAEVADVTANIFSDMAMWTAARKLTTISDDAMELMEAGMQINGAFELERATVICERIGVKLNVDLGGGLGAGGAAAGNDIMRLEELGAAANKWERIASFGGAFAKSITLGAMTAACVAAGYQIAHDFSSGQSTAVITFDILGGAANGIAFLVEAGSGIAALAGIEIASLIPVIGVVAAVVGIVAALVGLFLPRKHPLSPAVIFIRDKSTPFIRNLAMPDQKWLDDQGKKNDHLEPDRSLAFA